MDKKSYYAKYYQLNKDRLRQINKTNLKKNPNEKSRRFAYKLQRLYNISIEEYKLLLERQNNACAICKKPSRLEVDHSHVTGKVRGLLCRSCNLLLGNAQDNIATLQAAVSYLWADARD